MIKYIFFIGIIIFLLITSIKMLCYKSNIKKQKEKFDNEGEKKDEKKDEKIIDSFYNEKPSEIFIDIFNYSEPWRNGLANDKRDLAINI